MTNPDPLLRLIMVLEDELRLPVHERPSGATDDGLRSAIADAQQAMLEVVYDLTDDVTSAMQRAPATDRQL